MLNPAVPSVRQLRERFLSAKPFKHLCIDNFLIPSLAERLLSDFPPFDTKRAKNEMGAVGGKATREDVRALGSSYAEIDDLISSSKFLAFLSEVTDIPDLMYDPEYFGGGTHENIHGQELDVHVDFNRHRSSDIHRRLNLIVYLNKEWQPEWGGGIELHSDPRNPQNNEIITFEPIFNRCIVFETNEYSWHGFSKIRLPEHKQSVSRKSFAIYFYSATRPESEIVPKHNTFYIQRPLPSSIHEGVKLTKEQVDEIQGLLRKRDDWVHFYQKLELTMSQEIETSKHTARELWQQIRVSHLGYISQRGAAARYHADGWIESGFNAHFSAAQPVLALEVALRLSSEAPVGQTIRFSLNDVLVQKGTLLPGHSVTFSIPCAISAQEQFALGIEGDTFCPAKLGINADSRELLAVLESVTAYHPQTGK
jgi:hypothetical protein